MSSAAPHPRGSPGASGDAEAILAEYAAYTAAQLKEVPTALQALRTKLEQDREDVSVKNFRVFVEASRCLEAASEEATKMSDSCSTLDSVSESLLAKSSAFLAAVESHRDGQRRLNLLASKRVSPCAIIFQPISLSSGILFHSRLPTISRPPRMR